MNINTLKRFNLIPNSKNPTSDWAKKNRQKCFRTGIFTGNAGVPTGKVNNITVVDLDFYKITGENKFTTEFKDYITEFNTFTVQTGSGGVHLYFKYDEEIKQTVNDTFHIDIRSDGGYVVSPDSIVDGNEYKVIHNTTIKDIPQDIKQWLLENLYTIDTKIKASGKKRKEVKIQPITHKYNLSKCELKKILYSLPDKFWSNENYNFLKFTSFCKFFKIQDLWDEINKTKPKYNYDNNINCYWKIAQCSEGIIDYVLSLGTINYNDNKEKKQNYKNEQYINYSKFKPCPINKIKADKKINKQKLGYTFLKSKRNYLIKSDTGTGKTTSFKHYVKFNNLKFISIVSRISLADEQYYTFSKHGIKCKKYKLSKDHYVDLFNNDNVVITIDSIRRLYDFDFSQYVIFLDEYNSLLEYLTTTSTLAKNRSIIYRKFLHIIRNCKQVICADADLNDISIHWM